jgi:uncharacterized RDD family membrane protein YckC
MENTEVINEDLLTDEIHPYFQYSHATQGQRFLNFFIDNVLMRLTLTYGTGFVLGKILMLLSPDLMLSIVNDNGRTGLYILAYLIILLNYLVYYTLCEKLFRGKTIGKFFTKTKALRNDGGELTFKDALLRSLCRLIPFEVFSGFGVPWHDSITNTMVVKTGNY